MKAFLTGSRAYGKNKRVGQIEVESDIDVVLLVEPELLSVLFEHADNGGSAKDGFEKRGGASLRFGLLNLLCVNESEYEIWKKVTGELKARKPVTRDEAVKAFKRALGEDDD